MGYADVNTTELYVAAIYGVATSYIVWRHGKQCR